MHAWSMSTPLPIGVDSVDNFRPGFCDGWLMFDSFLVFFMVAETWVMPILIPGTDGAGLSVPRDRVRG